MALHELAGERIIDCSSSRQRPSSPTGHSRWPSPSASARPAATTSSAWRPTTAPPCTSPGSRASTRTRHRVVTWDGRELPFDVLLVAVGARATTSIPGSVMIQGPGYTGRFRTVLRDLDERRVHNVAFAVPPGASWPLPLYELALMTATHVAEHGLRKVRLSLVTPEAAPLELFGAAASEAVRRAARGTRHRAPPLALPHAASRTASCRSYRTETLSAERVVSLPQPGGPTARGAARRRRTASSRSTSTASCSGEQDVYAAGDATTSPIKQGGVATQQADAAAEAIAARAGCRPGAAAVPAGACVGCCSPARRRATCAPR